MASYNPDTTWIGLLGGGVSGSIIGGGSIFQIDLWHMGGNPLPVRVLVTGKRVGAVAEVGTAMCALLVTGVRNPKDMDGITSSGLDWELAVGLKASALAKTGASLFKAAAAEAISTGVNWATHESGKRLVQWIMGDLGIVQSGKQFNLIPSPVAVSVGAGIFYEWQTLNLLGGKIGWQYMSPQWSVENVQGDVWIIIKDIPEQDGEYVKLGFAVDEWGIDPHIRWKGDRSGARVGSNKIHINAWSYHGFAFDDPKGQGFAGVNLSNYLPIGRSEAGVMSVERTKTIAKNTTLTVRPQIFEFGNYEYWSASETMKVDTDGDGRFVKVHGNSNLRD